MTITKIDLFKDWIEIISEKNDNYDITGLDEDEIAIEYFSSKKKLIQTKKREIKKSNVFSCPTNLQSGLSLIESKIENGNSLRPHQTRSLKNLSSKDGMLFDWGIYHLHLGVEIESDGFIKRTGLLLYLLVDSNNAYFIDVQDHGKWSKQEFLKIIDENWPELIDKNKIPKNGDIVGLAKKYTDDEIAQLRKANVNVLVETDSGDILINPGGGVASSGHSMEAVEKHMKNKKGLNQYQQNLETNTEEILNEIFQDGLGFIQNPNLRFKMKRENGRFYLEELNNNFTLVMNQ